MGDLAELEEHQNYEQTCDEHVFFSKLLALRGPSSQLRVKSFLPQQASSSPPVIVPSASHLVAVYCMNLREEFLLYQMLLPNWGQYSNLEKMPLFILQNCRIYHAIRKSKGIVSSDLPCIRTFSVGPAPGNLHRLSLQGFIQCFYTSNVGPMDSLVMVLLVLKYLL